MICVYGIKSTFDINSNICSYEYNLLNFYRSHFSFVMYMQESIMFYVDINMNSMKGQGQQS